MSGCRSVLAILLGLSLGLLPASGSRANELDEANMTRLLNDVREREIALERREREVGEREQSVDAIEAQLSERLAELEEIRKAIESRIREWEGQDPERIKKLSKLYAEMPPEAAAPLLEKLDPDLATSIVTGMKSKDGAAVLAVMTRDDAVDVSRRVARPLELRPDDEEEGGTR